MRAVPLAVIALVAVGCTRAGAFVCDPAHDQCGANRRCDVATRFCEEPAAGCASGWRYVSAGVWSERCVGDGAGPDLGAGAPVDMAAPNVVFYKGVKTSSLASDAYETGLILGGFDLADVKAGDLLLAVVHAGNEGVDGGGTTPFTIDATDTSWTRLDPVAAHDPGGEAKPSEGRLAVFWQVVQKDGDAVAFFFAFHAGGDTVKEHYVGWLGVYRGADPAHPFVGSAAGKDVPGAHGSIDAPAVAPNPSLPMMRDVFFYGAFTAKGTSLGPPPGSALAAANDNGAGRTLLVADVAVARGGAVPGYTASMKDAATFYDAMSYTVALAPKLP